MVQNLLHLTKELNGNINLLTASNECMQSINNLTTLQLSPNSLLIGKKQSRPTFTGHQVFF